ncbi:MULTISPECIES: hypothetical protein [unclassified Burkholderia]|uniref:hypothetical protein n=1 Tax=unclassified Burkholderia TaxID=2613784 RepID=UPI00214FF397|nr:MULTISPECIES: hypothetical protein [unclassified Burkholderia]MCR4471832.1 hypothetical protein [Burkholderia sp. SCN-KJ]
MNPVTLGIDSGKRWFHVVGCDAAGKAVLRKKLGAINSCSLWHNIHRALSASKHAVARRF